MTGKILTSGRDNLWCVGLLLLVFLLGCFSMGNGDIWWHLKTGQLIWQRGEVPGTDWYTYTNSDSAWIDLHWGFQLAAVALWSMGGATALIIAKSVLGTATVGVCLTMVRPGWPQWQTVALWLGSVLVMAGRYYVRPEMVSLLLFSLVLAVLFHSKSHPRLLWCLPLIQLVWVNMQGLFALQYVVMGCFLLDRLLKSTIPAVQKRSEGQTLLLHWPSWLAVLALTCVASLINPYGWKGAMFPWVLLQKVRGSGREFYQQFGAELAGTDVFVRNLLQQIRAGETNILILVRDPSFTIQMLLFVSGAATFFLLARHGRFSVYRVLLFGAFAYLAWQMTRNSVFFALIAGLVIRWNVGELTEMSASSDRRGRRRYPRETGDQSQSRLAPALVGIVLVLLIISVPTNLYSVVRPSLLSRRFGFGEAAWYGHDAARFLQQPGMPRHVYAQHLGQAAVCIFHLSPESRVFVDARLEVNTRDTLQRYREIAQQIAAGDPMAEDNLRRGTGGHRHHLPALLFDNHMLVQSVARGTGLLQSLLDGGRWRCVYCNMNPDRQVAHVAPGVQGASVFLDVATAERLGLAEDENIRQLDVLGSLIRDVIEQGIR